jgi:hypothetical protein
MVDAAEAFSPQPQADNLARWNWRYRLFFIGCVVLFFTFSFRNYFVADDFEFLGRIRLSNASQYFARSWGYGNEYRPLLVYTYAFNRILGGTDPFFYHLTNTLIHAANAVLGAMIFGAITGGRAKPFLTAICFAINPVTHESVLWISGRPVLLGAFFGLSAIWLSIGATEAKDSGRWWTLMHLSFWASLLSYEGAVIIPCLVLLVSLSRPRDRRVPRKQIIALLLTAAVYVVAWNVLFGFRITRFAVEHSPVNMLKNLVTAAGHVLHGSSRLAVALVYAIFAVVLFTWRGNLRIVLAALAWFVIAYLPYLIVHGYADRFSYLSAVGIAAALGLAVIRLSAINKLAGAACGAAVLSVLAIGMMGRMQVWRKAGEIARRIPTEIRSLHPDATSRTSIILLNVPPTYRDAYVFLTGIERAVSLEYGGRGPAVYRQAYANLPDSTWVIDCSGKHVRDIGVLGVLRAKMVGLRQAAVRNLTLRISTAS